MNPNLIRSQFLDFFRERGHTIIPSAPVTPHGDSTLLFTNAGMNQFKDVFLEQGSRSYTRVADSQKCIRVSGKHNDLDEVGPSPSHHTFFEMLGNWSFGDYYKSEAIKWAWELLTKVWGLDPGRLHASIFAGDEQVSADEEAYRVWREEVGLADAQITRHGKKDNFWEMGEVGPCGPCSELHYDFGPSFCRRQSEPAHTCQVNGDCGRIVELWNLVFIQYRRDDKGDLHPLPRKHIDTGAGFERILKALEGVSSNYETSIFTPLIAEIARLSGVPYEKDTRGNPHRIAADHIRMVSFALADGVLPSNDGRGYVVRRVLRRAARYGREIGLEAPYMHKLVEPLLAIMGEAYPELTERRDHIVGVIKAEEESFGRTLGRGLEIFGGLVEKIKHKGTNVIDGEDAFKLYDTYGFPLDLTELMARERGLTVDVVRFNELMKVQKELARGECEFKVVEQSFYGNCSSRFVGYDTMQVSTKVLGVFPREIQDENDNNAVKKTAEIILEETPFYAESGGQVSDQGWIEIGGFRTRVRNVKKVGDAIVHFCDYDTDVIFPPGTPTKAWIEEELRVPTQYNHTATHLLHTALRTLVGKHCAQAGSLVAPDRLRFDFTHFERLSEQQIEQIERMVNKAIRDDYPVRWYEKTYQEALDSGIIALFGEKYGDVVRVVHIGSDAAPFSRELCGGCHVTRTGQIGYFRIVSESAVSAGVRRIEAVTGEYALNWSLEERRQLEAVQDLVGSRGSDPVDKLQKTLAEKKALEKELERLLVVWASSEASELLSKSIIIQSVHLVYKHYPPTDIERLKLVGDALRSRNSRVAALLVAEGENGAGQLLCVVGDAAIAESKLKAGDLVGKAAKLAGGGGGGRPHMAAAGTKTPERLDAAIWGFKEIVEQQIGINTE